MVATLTLPARWQVERLEGGLAALEVAGALAPARAEELRARLHRALPVPRLAPESHRRPTHRGGCWTSPWSCSTTWARRTWPRARPRAAAPTPAGWGARSGASRKRWHPGAPASARRLTVLVEDAGRVDLELPALAG